MAGNFDDIEFSDDDGGMSNQPQLSIKEIILRQIKKIGDICCKEFTGGYWERKPIKTSGGVLFTEQYHEDVRESYCNAIDFLTDLLYPNSDDEFRTYIDDNDSIEIDWKDDEIKEKVKQKRKTFKEINNMFERVGYWGSNGFGTEGGFNK